MTTSTNETTVKNPDEFIRIQNADGTYTDIPKVYPLYAKLVEAFPIEKYSITLEPVSVNLLVSEPDPGLGAMQAKIMDITSGIVIRNAFAVRMTAVSFDAHGTSKLQSDALRNLLKMCNLYDEAGNIDDVASATDACAAISNGASIVVSSMPEAKVQTLSKREKSTSKIESVPTEKTAKKGTSSSNDKPVPKYLQPSKTQLDLILEACTVLNVPLEALRDTRNQVEAKLLLSALKKAKKVKNDSILASSSKEDKEGADDKINAILAPFALEQG